MRSMIGNLSPALSFAAPAAICCAMVVGASLRIEAAPAEPVSAAPKKVTFAKDIAPIFQKACQDCHRDGEVAPMSLLTFEDARPWAKSIKKYVADKSMPPWGANPAYGKFKNDPRLSSAEIDTIVKWVDDGAVEGDPKDLPPPKKFVKGWRIGEPDVVFTMPKKFRVKAEGTIRYQYITIPTNFKEDKWIVAGEARPGNPAVVHHILVFVQEPGKRIRNLWQNHLCGMAPGTPPDVYPDGAAKFVKAGSQLLLQLHYTPTGKEEFDQSSVGLIFAKEPPKRRMRLRAVMNHRLRIPPGASAYESTASYRFRRPGTIYGFQPHMHLRGKSFRYEIIRPDGSSEIVLDVPEYDFNWQHAYELATPIDAKRDWVIKCTAVYDNSKENPFNPNPDQEVRWGDQTWEEMMIGFVGISFDNEILSETAAAPK